MIQVIYQSNRRLCGKSSSRVFDISSQSKLKLRRKQNIMMQIYVNKVQISSRLCDFVCLSDEWIIDEYEKVRYHELVAVLV